MNQCQNITDRSQLLNTDVTAFLCGTPLPPTRSISHHLVCMDSLFIVKTIHMEWNKTLFF